jgi:signal transduction histidine kinase
MTADSRSAFGLPRSLRARTWLSATVALAAAVATIWITADADFLAHPGWLAAQKADFILGPVLIGLYWLRARPRSRFGWLLIAFGFLCAGYVTQSLTTPWLFGTGLLWESFIYLGTLVLILTFPTGRLDGVAAKLVAVAGAAAAAFNIALVVMLPETNAGGAISGCRQLCPRNGVAFAPDPARALDLLKPFQIVVICVAAATAAFLIWRIATGTPPQRRALAIGTSVALLFTALQITFLSLSVFDVNAPELMKVIQWAFTAARALVWYGFLFALVAAQLFAGRALQQLVRGSLQRPSRRELEAMLRQPLGDPTFQLRLWDPRRSAWAGGLEHGARDTVTVIERAGSPAVALIHDAQLDDDPELLQAAGAVALLAAENAELDDVWKEAFEDVERSRERVARAVYDERRRVAINLHDGVQQRLGALRLRLAMTAELVPEEPLRNRLESIGNGVDDTLEEVREVAHGLYPHLLIEQGLVPALEHALLPIAIRHNEILRHPPELESAVYYCCLEAVQNARKHGGPNVQVSVSLREDAGSLSFEVTDDGPGFDRSTGHPGLGLQSLKDRLGGVGGRLAITGEPGRGTVVAGTVPLRPARGAGLQARQSLGRSPSFGPEERL